MYQIVLLVSFVLLHSGAFAERIKRGPPDETELAHIASDQAINDGDLRKGDIISTDRGFLQLRGLRADGSYDFMPVHNPLATEKRGDVNFR